jgi:predicted DNA-binding protein with PD1-like motif
MHYFVSEGAPRIILAIFERDDFLLEGLQDVVQKEGIETAAIVSGIGSLQRANIHTFARFGFPPEEKYQTFEGALEMGSLQGSVIGSEVHAHVTFYHWDTRASMVGHLDPGTQVAYMAEVTLVEIEGVRAARFRDAVGDYRVRDLTRVAVRD